MEVEIRTELGRQEPKIVILAGEESEELRRLADSLSKLALGPVPVVREEEKLLLPQGDFLRFYADGKGVSAQTAAETFTVRRVAHGCGVERVFPIHSPHVEKVEIIRRGKVRRSKLYYLRGRVGKAAKVKGQIQ